MDQEGAMPCPMCGGPDMVCGCYDQQEPEPTVEDYCDAAGHVRYAGGGSCYCGRRQYPDPQELLSLGRDPD